MRTFLLFFLAMALTAATTLKAQLNVGSTALPDASAVLQATSTNKGVLFPNLTTVQRDAIASPAAGLVVFNTTTNQLEFNAGTAISKNWQAVGGSAIGQLPLVSLTAINAPAPFATNVTGIMVYNTATAGSGNAAVVPGVYVNDGTQWRLVMLMAASFATFTAGTIDCSGALAGTYTVSTAMAATNIKIINITAIGVGAYTASTDTQNGVSFTTSGNITTTGSTAITLTASGTPIAGGTFTYTVSIGGQNCTFSVTYVYPPATFGTGTIDCSGTLAGTYNSSIAMTAANTKTINITITTAGTYTASTDTQNGVSFTASGTATTTGATAITFTASGTPTAAGTFIYNATIGGQTCVFLVSYTLSPATFTAGTLSCTSTPTGTYAAYAPMTASNTKTVTIGVATAGSYSATTDTQNGVVFSVSGTLPNAGGPPKSIILTASGTPTTSGTFTYTITIGGQTCTFGVTYTATIATFTAGTINCSGALAGVYTKAAPMTTANTKTISISVNTIGNYSVVSAAVNGVTFSAPTTNGVSSVNATGINSIALVASGTPLAIGTFTYNVSISIGGGPSSQSCSFTVTYLAPPATLTPNSIDCSGSLAGNYYATIPMVAANTKTISINAATVGSYTGTTDTQNGVSFSGTGSTTVVGTSTLAMVASGSPIAGGTFTYTATIAGQTCTFPVTFSADVATFAAGTIDCSGTLAGTYSYLPLTSSNTKIITITPISAGSYTAATNTVNGVTFNAVGATAATGTTTVTLVASGTPIGNGTFTYTVTIAGQTCTFPVTYTFVQPTFAANSMNCTGAANGTYTVGVPMNASNFKTTTISVVTPGSLYGIFTAGQSTTTYTGIGFIPTQTLSNTGAATVTWTASGTPIVSGTYNFNINLGGQNCNFNVTIAPPIAYFTAGTIDCSGALSGSYVMSQSMSPLNKKIININAAGIGSYSATTDTKNGVTFLSSGTIASTGSNAIQFGASGTPTAAGTFTYTATIGGQTCTFDVTYVPLATYSSVNCNGTLTGVYNTGVAMTAANTKALQTFALTAGVYTATTPTINGVKFAVTGTQATGNDLATYSLAATGTPIAAGTFSYNVVIGNQNCSFNVVYTTPVATVGSIDCTGTLAGSYNTGVAMAGTNTKIINITGSSIGSYNATTDTQNGVNFSAVGIITAIGVKSVTLVGTGTPAAAGTFTYTVTVAGQTCQFTVVFTTDALRTSLSAAGCASCSAYDAAVVNTWVPITAAEYDATALATNITDAGIYGTSEADMVSGAGAFPNSGTNETCTPFSLPTVANTYIYGLSMEVIGSGAGQGFQVKAVPVSAPTDVITDYPATGALATVTSTISTRTRLYFVLKQPTAALVPVSYIGGYEPNGMNLSFGYPAGGGVNSRYVGTGNVTTAMFANPGNYRVQLLGTVTKQW